MWSVVALYGRLRLPTPWTPATKLTPFLIYGASSAVGAFALKLAVASNIHPIIAIAGQGSPYVEQLIDRTEGDIVVDYRQAEKGIIADIQVALKSSGTTGLLDHVFDAVGAANGCTDILEKLAPNANFVTAVPVQNMVYPETVQHSMITVGAVHGQASIAGYDFEIYSSDKDLGYVFSRYFTWALSTGSLTGHPFEVVPGGLLGLESALIKLKDGKASAKKYVVRVQETPGLEEQPKALTTT